jgi:hypothetical protein
MHPQHPHNIIPQFPYYYLAGALNARLHTNNYILQNKHEKNRTQSIMLLSYQPTTKPS